jgi:two-component system, NtrC family, sensor kinase
VIPAPTTLNERTNLEKLFALALLVLLVLSVVSYFRFQAEQASVLTMVLLASVAFALAVSVAHVALFKPLRRLLLMARAVGAGDFSKRLGFKRRDELGSLAFEMDALCGQLEAAQLAAEAHIVALDQLRHSDRVATLGRLASSVAHELGNPLNVIELRAQLITSGDAATLQHAQQNAAVIVEQTRRMTRIIDEILSFARMQPAKITRVDLVGVVRKASVLSEHTSKKYRTSIAFEVPLRTVVIDGDADKLLQIIVNLVINGVQAMTSGGTLYVSMSDERRAPIDDREGEPRDYVCIHVVDCGVGISPEVISKVFEPFFSTKHADGGTGLGLSVAQGIAREHEGWISVESELGRGSSFTVHLPKHGLKGSHDES